MGNNKIRIGVSGTGGGVGQSIIKALQNSDYEVVAMDGEVLAAGLHAVNKSYIIPYASKPDFVERIIEICTKEKCRLFFPGLDAELPVLTAAAEKFKAAGVELIVSQKSVIELSDNKLLTYKSLLSHGVSVPMTMQASSDAAAKLGYPFILKPRLGGARSKDVYLVKDKSMLDTLLAGGLQFTDFVAQEYIEGEEYTCGSINVDGKCHGVIVMRRILRDGDTYKCFPVKDELIEATVQKIMDSIQPYGACNVQLRVRDGTPYVFEINARCSGTTAARALSGFNEPLMIADYVCHGKKPTYNIKEQTILRYWNELVVDNNAVDTLGKNGTLTNSQHQNLW